MPTLKCNTEPTRNKALFVEVAEALIEKLANVWDASQDTKDGSAIETSFSCSAISKTAGKASIATAKVTSFAKKYPDGRTITTKPSSKK
jgi:hypothetical protein